MTNQVNKRYIQNLYQIHYCMFKANVLFEKMQIGKENLKHVVLKNRISTHAQVESKIVLKKLLSRNETFFIIFEISLW